MNLVMARTAARRKQLLVMFSLFGVGFGAMTYANYHNTEIDVVFQDSELMNYVVKKVPSLFKVPLVQEAVRGDFLLPVPVHGADLLREVREAAVREGEGGAGDLRRRRVNFLG